MLRTVIATLFLSLLGASSASLLTEGFQVWTAEGARRLAVQNHPVAAPTAKLAGPGLNGQDLRAVLATPGTVTLASFIYTRCDSICLTLGSSFQQLQRTIDTQQLDGVRLLSISFDPAYDSAARLQQYASRWGADPRRWRFATVPDQRELQQLLRAFKVVVIADGLGGYEHNAALMVIDQHGRLVHIFDETELDAALAYALASAHASSHTSAHPPARALAPALK
jgi:protein SCO1